MPTKIRENLSLDKVFALIETKGIVAASVKRHKLKRTHIKATERDAGFQRCAQFMQSLDKNQGLAAKLENLFVSLPELAFNHLQTTEVFELHELYELKSFFWVSLQLTELLANNGLFSLHHLPDLNSAFNLLDPEGNRVPSFRISPLYSSNLAKLLSQQQDLALQLKQIRAKDMDKAKNELGISTLKEEFVLSRQRQETLNSLMNSKSFILISESLANCSFRLADSPEALELKAKLHELAIGVTEEEGVIRKDLTRQLKEQFDAIEQAWNSSTELTWDYSLAQFALRYQCCIPRLTPNFSGITITQAVNLPLKLILEQNQRHYQSLDLAFDHKANLITGPNMGGKSTALITLGQMCYLARLGIPLPAKDATLCVFDEIYYNHDDGDSSETLSSFGREVVSLTQMLQRSGTKLILLDEFAKGTNPAEGEALCVATLKYLLGTDYTIMAATHFTAPTLLKGMGHYYIKGIAPESFKALEDSGETDLEARLKLLSQAMDYSLVPAQGISAPAKCAVAIAGILGLPKAILSQIEGT